MKLNRVEINNFRSIEAITVDFDPTCRVLVGINESGKSNILRALSMLGEEFSPTPEDVREPSPKEKSIEGFVFSLDKNETDKVCSSVKQKLLGKERPLLLKGGKKFTLKSFCSLRNEGLYQVDILQQKKSPSYWALDDTYTVLKGWKKPSANCPADFNVETKKGKVHLKNYPLIDTEEYTEVPEEYLEEIDAEYINRLVGTKTQELISVSLPKVIFWKYDEQNLLPPSVDIDTFSADPDSCVPLRNMFTLAGIKDMADEIKKAKDISPNKFRNLLRRVASHTTRHFRSVWKEYKEIKFALEPNANTIEANIVEENYWKMSQRSDGVKRFTTFLLHISANIKVNLLNDALLLIDEPDISLHPSGSRYLRDELIENSKKNYVVFSTHSIFMIDKDNINRHIIVKKQGEKTTIINADVSNFVDEEVLFNALNYTVFDILKQDNIIFEGWRDKKLFQTAFKKVPSTHTAKLKGLKERLKKIGLCHAEGVKDVRNITPLIELANRNCLILSDTDDAAKEKQKEYQKIRGYGTWKRYDEVSPGSKEETGEDFIREAVFLAHIEKLKGKYPTLTGDPTITASGRMSSVKAWLSSQGIAPKDLREMLMFLKNSIFDALKPSDVDVSYYDFLEGLSTVVDMVLPQKS